MNRPLLHFTIFLLFGTASVGLHAHGESPHGSDPGPVVKEQTAWGIAADPELATRTIEVVMTDDMRFTPHAFAFREGETVRLSVRNAGQIMHELVIGDAESLREHAEMMLRFPDMEHEEPYMAHVPPGEMAEIVWTFNRSGVFEFACLIPGHYQSGMRAEVAVQDPAGDVLAAPRAAGRTHLH
jgi:uncharacterized cupredoxin-like copper-binding protein